MPALPLRLAALLILLASAAVASRPSATNPWYPGGSDWDGGGAGGAGGGGGQRYAESLKSHHLEHGAPAHPLHADRDSVRSGQSGVAAFSVGMGSTVATQPFSHFFETCVGSGHMSLTLREDWRNHLRMSARDLGVKHIRGHGLLDDDMSVSFAYGKHAFYNIDSLVDVLLSVGM